MADIVAPDVRSRMMSGIRGRDTRPELRVRRYLHRVGFRFRLHAKHLPGNPDLVLPRLKTAIFVHGCFWHRHAGCPDASTPSTRRDFWLDKFAANVARDGTAQDRLRELGWTVLTIWECETKSEVALDQLAWALFAIAVGHEPISP